MAKSVRLILSRLMTGTACILLAAPIQAEMRPSINVQGNTGLIDMPSGDQQPDGYLSYDHSRIGDILRNSLRFQITPRLSGTFRYIGLHQWNSKVASPFPTYYDRNFDLSYQILTEGRYLPSLTIGLQDFVGTGLDAAEYVAATKTFGGRLKFTAGIGFGRLGSYGSIGQPFGPRRSAAVGTGGNVNFKEWFRGDAAPFGGIEYQVNDRWTLKAEYSSDAYKEEAAKRGLFERKSPLNFGVEYQANRAFRFGYYYLYGSEVGFNMTIMLNPDQRPQGGIGGPGPEPVKPRPSPTADPAAWSTAWMGQADAKEILIGNMTRNLVRTGIDVESLGMTADTAQIRFRNTNYDATAQAVGRVARAMSQVMPASIEVFEIVPMEHGVPGSKVVIRRSDLEALEFSPDQAAALRARVAIAEGGSPLPDTLRNPAAYPRLTWSLLPFVRTRTFDPSNPLQAGVGLRFAAQYELAPGLVLSGSVTSLAVSNIKDRNIPDPSPLPPVRRDSVKYDTKANPDLETLTAAYFTRIAPNLFGRITVGYLERMFGGVSTEVLYRPVDRPWAVGIEADYVAQRNTDGMLGFGEYDYRVMTGHLSGYYDLGKGYHVQVDLGRYLAGDVGGTLTFSREFENGWKVGAFATKTNVSAKDFGEGSFDKGIFLQIPMAWFSGKPTRVSRPLVIRPIGRDGGARLDVNDRLYDLLRSEDQTRIDAQWGRVWK